VGGFAVNEVRRKGGRVTPLLSSAGGATNNKPASTQSGEYNIRLPGENPRPIRDFFPAFPVPPGGPKARGAGPPKNGFSHCLDLSQPPISRKKKPIRKLSAIKSSKPESETGRSTLPSGMKPWETGVRPPTLDALPAQTQAAFPWAPGNRAKSQTVENDPKNGRSKVC